ncbi:MAG TPA: metallophosphoesterase [Kofleriaceae bacterium]|nr:metallophosphoesterase [Kofleriaceae bacterium]
MLDDEVLDDEVLGEVPVTPPRPALAWATAAVAACAAAACLRPGEDRAADDLGVGIAALADANVQVAGGLAAVRALADHRLELWSQAPALDVQLVLLDTAAGDWTITIRNVLPDAVLVTGGATYARAPGDRPTVATFRVPLPAGTHELRVGPPDADRLESYRVAALADIQTALPSVHEVFAAINAVPDLRFVVGMGDLTERGYLEEYELYERQLETLQIPYYTTLGNHELWSDHMRFLDRFGRASFQFRFKGVAFTFADSGDAGLAPLVEEWVDGWLTGARGEPHVFLTHIPPVDPLGLRYGSFRSTRDGRRLLSRLAAANVDLTLYGHVHTFVAYDNAGIPAFISGGGGAQPMRLDGIDRHFLVIELAPLPTSAALLAPGGIAGVDVHRVD